MSNLVLITVPHGDGIACAKQNVGTKQFRQAVVARPGNTPDTLKAAHYFVEKESAVAKVSLDGVDVYVTWPSLKTNRLAAAAQKANDEGLGGTMIDNGGVKGTFDGQPGYTLAQGQ